MREIKMLLVGVIAILLIIASAAVMLIAIRPLILSTEIDKAEVVNRTENWLSNLYQHGKFSGVVLLAKNGQIVFQHSVGYENLINKKPLTIHSSFNLASVSKQFTAAGVILLKHRGMLSYDDKLSKYIPELNFYHGLTLKHLLHHTSGLPDYMRLTKDWNVSKLFSNSELIKLLANTKPSLNFNPGDKFEYSNTGYVLLSEVIARITGVSFSDFMDQNIFQPLGMKNTSVFNLLSEGEPENRVFGYKPRYWPFGGSLQQKDLTFLDGVTGDGSIYSSAYDLYLWHQALNQGSVIPVEEYKIAFESAKLNSGENNDYGFGWFLGNKFIEHAGGWQGFATFLRRNLESDEVIIVLDNSGNILRVTSMGIRLNSIPQNLMSVLRLL